MLENVALFMFYCDNHDSQWMTKADGTAGYIASYVMKFNDIDAKNMPNIASKRVSVLFEAGSDTGRNRLKTIFNALTATTHVTANAACRSLTGTKEIHISRHE